MTALDGQPTTSAPEDPAGTASSSVRAPSSRRHGVASIALGVAILATLVVAVVYLVAAPASVAREEAPAAAAPASPAAPPPSAQPSVQPAPPAAAAPATPALTDTSGAPLPAPVATGVSQLAGNLASGNVAAIQPAYVPGRAVRAAPWPTVANLLADPANRAGLVAALQTPPTSTPDGWRYTSPTGNQVGVDPQGHVSFVRLS